MELELKAGLQGSKDNDLSTDKPHCAHAIVPRALIFLRKCLMNCGINEMWHFGNLKEEIRDITNSKRLVSKQ